MNHKISYLLMISALACLSPGNASAEAFTLNDSVAHSRITRGQHDSGDDDNNNGLFYRITNLDDDHGNGQSEGGSRVGRQQLDTEFSMRDLMASINWSGSPAPDLDLVVLQAGNYYVSWDLSGVDLAPYDSLEVINDMIRNTRGSNRLLLGITSIELFGSAGVVPNVPPPIAGPQGAWATPDGGSTAGMLAAAMGGVMAFRRRSVVR